ncbi:DUF6879 family protein [Glycomyces tenuis]|uniref:DUF6879 family protein n=1 Tax=Glycomyces tenuis TaxID=58116 RepID=UPI00040ED638|nr:DUF6879 family protein [Glycomyces tenuis]
MGRTITSLDDPEFSRPFREFRYTAYRLEALQRYTVPSEEAPFERFQAGEERGAFPGIAQWIDETIAPAVAEGRRLHRVHVVELPVSDYVRFEAAWAYAHTAAAGEEIRILPVEQGEWPAELPHYDYWLFDSRSLLSMYYDDDGRFVSARYEDDPELIVRANHWRDIAVTLSVPYRDFAETLVSSPA